ncbi:hypothetical protein [Actinophytocola xanthii]|uniref:Uncharacterized protein n=1 Tax=Actinophytocola xanthii TaxID=1912961 RepID=A0A1Q8CSG8_9PSEU|nr:hypothetical protein [Actinophytocola xanthii]OLF17304.1 hypothetical protein BU204_11835 [Actinophytocola xanthii]
MNDVPPPDETAHLDGLFMHEVTEVNTQLARYVIGHLDADAGRRTPMSTSEERALASRLTEVAEAMNARADLRDEHGTTQLLSAETTDQPS